jgi:hypothetical protein
VVETVLEPAQLHQQRAEILVAQPGRVDARQLVERSPERLQHIVDPNTYSLYLPVDNPRNIGNNSCRFVDNRPGYGTGCPGRPSTV